MSNTMLQQAQAHPKGNLDDLVADGEDMELALVRRLLRDAIDESRWKDSAVAEAIGLKGPAGAAYFSKMLSGDKPIGAKHLRALPDEIEAIFVRLWAETFGYVVIAPLRGEDAVRSFAAGLLGLFAQLPSRADRMARVALDAEPERKRA
jgi:hypothetical protein